MGWEGEGGKERNTIAELHLPSSRQKLQQAQAAHVYLWYIYMHALHMPPCSCTSNKFTSLDTIFPRYECHLYGMIYQTQKLILTAPTDTVYLAVATLRR